MPVFNFENIQRLLLELAQHKTVSVVLKRAVDSLHVHPEVALVRVWLLESQTGDCTHCRWENVCGSPERCLRLKASAGRSIVDGHLWNRVDGAFSSFPLGRGKVGVIAKEGKPIEVLEVDPSESWVADADWMRLEKIVSFVGQPLVCQDEVMGVLSVFSREKLEQSALGMLRMVADHLAYALSNARAFETIAKLKQQADAENAYLREEIKEAQDFLGIIGRSSQLGQIRDVIREVAPTDANVLIYGESGTGKEMVAREIHNNSPRRNKPMIRINCSAIPRELFESEFFGHARGAFTGAVQSRIGYFQAADGGTLFLDEVGEIPVHLQSKLLRVIQEGEYRRVGEDSVRSVDVRIISATNRDLHSAVKSGRFREDLYYRLQVFPIEIPPLRERREDIELLTDHYIKLYSKKLNRPNIQLKETHRQVLASYDWPGNIRELQNIIERLLITARPDQVLMELQRHTRPTPATPPDVTRSIGSQKVLSNAQLRELEIENMKDALRRSNWKIYGPRGAAELLSMKPTTLISRLKKLGLYKHQE